MDEGITAVLDAERVVAGRHRHGGAREVEPEDARHLQQRLVISRHVRELALDHPAHALRNPERHLVDRLAQFPSPTPRDQHAACDEVIDEAGHEQGVALRTLMDQRRERAREAIARTLRVEVLTDVGDAESVQDDLGAPPVHEQFSPHGPERMVRRGGVGGAIRGQDHEAGAARPWLRQERQQVEGRHVAPVQVLQDEEERRVPGERVDGLAHLAQHARRSRAERLPLQRVDLVRVGHRGHLGEPGRSVPPEHCRDARAVRPAAERSERLQNRQVGLARPVVLHTLPSADADPGNALHTGHEGLHQGRLADSGFARKEHDLLIAGPRPLERGEEPGDLASPTDGGAADRTPGRGRAGGEPGDRSDEPVPASVFRGDEPRAPGIVAEGAPDLPDASLQHRIAHVDARPDGVEQFVLRHQEAWTGGEVLEDPECLRPQRDDPVAAVHPFVGDIHSKRREATVRLGLHRMTRFSPESNKTCTPLS
ncbi:MAG TPA: hypothetical protein VNN07_07455 [Candidatus Tectomicrobia bacterium]|nr:hypothetical protein [Candidatus Tectomicrobia bacterium]